MKISVCSAVLACLPAVVSCAVVSAEAEPEVQASAAAVTAELPVVPIAAAQSFASAGSSTFESGAVAFYQYPAGAAACRDGSPAGVTVKKGTDPSKLVIYLKGGGFCFDAATCGLSDTFLVKPRIQPADRRLGGTEAPEGLLDLQDPANPLSAWNVVYVPYCTGDLHMGTRISSVPNGPQNQKFFGRKNLLTFLRSVTATFDPDQVLVVGESAGGAGTGVSGLAVEKAFADAAKQPSIQLLDDSGPFLSSGATFETNYLPTCAQAAWRTLWGLDDSILYECGAACRANGSVVPNFVPAYAGYVLQHFTALGQKPAFVVSHSDAGLGLIFGTTKNSCVAWGNLGYSMENALDHLRASFPTTLRTYYIKSNQHTHVNQPSYYDTTQQGVVLNDWISDILAGEAVTESVGPDL